MTNYIKKLLAGAAFALVCVTPVLADCEHGAKTEIMDTLKETSHAPVTDEQLKKLVEAKGPVPATKEGIPLEAELFIHGDMALIVFFQEGCRVQQLGPGPAPVVLALLGLSGA